MRIERLQQEYEIDLKYTFFPLHPDVSDQGITLEELFQGRNFDLKAAQQHIRNLASAEGLEMEERTKTYNSRLAQELGKWGESQPGGEKIHARLYRAYFVDDINLAQIDSLVAVAQELKLDGNTARSVLENREYRDSVDADWNHCREIGVMAVPTYLCGDKHLIGAQPYEALENLVKSLGAVKRN